MPPHRLDKQSKWALVRAARDSRKAAGQAYRAIPGDRRARAWRILGSGAALLFAVNIAIVLGARSLPGNRRTAVGT